MKYWKEKEVLVISIQLTDLSSEIKHIFWSNMCLQRHIIDAAFI